MPSTETTRRTRRRRLPLNPRIDEGGSAACLSIEIEAEEAGRAVLDIAHEWNGRGSRLLAGGIWSDGQGTVQQAIVWMKGDHRNVTIGSTYDLVDRVKAHTKPGGVTAISHYADWRPGAGETLEGHYIHFWRNEAAS